MKKWIWHNDIIHKGEALMETHQYFSSQLEYIVTMGLGMIYSRRYNYCGSDKITHTDFRFKMLGYQFVARTAAALVSRGDLKVFP